MYRGEEKTKAALTFTEGHILNNPSSKHSKSIQKTHWLTTIVQSTLRHNLALEQDVFCRGVRRGVTVGGFSWWVIRDEYRIQSKQVTATAVQPSLDSFGDCC